MKVNRNSWHFKLWEKLGGDDRYHISLCGYVQRLFWMSLLYALTTVGVVGLVGIVIWGIGSTFYHHTLVSFCVLVVSFCFWQLSLAWHIISRRFIHIETWKKKSRACSSNG